MDRVTQQNAANSEEAASAAEQMNALSMQLKGHVHQLEEIISHAEADSNGASGQSTVKPQINRSMDHAAQTPVAAPMREQVSPETVIPLKDDDFTDF